MKPETIQRYESLYRELTEAGEDFNAFAARHGTTPASLSAMMRRSRKAGASIGEIHQLDGRVYTRKITVEDRYRAAVEKGWTLQDIATTMNVAPTTAAAALRRYGLRPRNPHRVGVKRRMLNTQRATVTRAREAIVYVRDYATLHTVAYAADVSGAPVWAVEAARKALGLPVFMTLEQLQGVM